MPFLSLQDEQYPHLVFINDRQPYPWTAGFLYTLWLRSALLRVSARGVQLVAGSPRTGILEAGGWHEARCLPTAGALCNFTVGGLVGPAHTPATNMLLFPTGAVDVPDNFHSLTANGHAFLEHFNNSSPCTYSASHREIVTRDTRYEVSLCDLLNANIDFVLTKDRVFWRQDGTTTAEYVLFSLLGIVIVSQLTSNIMHIIQRGSPRVKKAKQAEHTDHRGHMDNRTQTETVSTLAHPALYAVFLLATTLFLTVRTWQHAAHYVVTQQDRAAALTLTLFTWTQYTQHYAAVLWSGLCALRAWAARNEHRESGYAPLDPTRQEKASFDPAKFTDHSFSLLIAILLLLILQVYFTTDTPYSTLMVTLFISRSAHKLLQPASAPRHAALLPPYHRTRHPSCDSVPAAPASLPFLVPAFAMFSKILDIFTGVLLLRGLALVQPDAVHTHLHLLCVVVVALLISTSMLRLESAIEPVARPRAAEPASNASSRAARI